MTFFDTITKWRWKKRQDERKGLESEKKRDAVSRKDTEKKMSAQKQIVDTSQGARSDKKIIASRGVVYGVLSARHFTEKTAIGEHDGIYTFIVRKDANANMVQRAVETRYGVAVLDVRTLTMPGKERRRGAQIGWKPEFKKAVVKLKKGESIET